MKSGFEIQLVDDQLVNLKILQHILTKQGYRVRTSSTGEQALDAAFEYPPDLILLDIMMPGMNGYEVCKRLKADTRTRDIPVIFISSKSVEKDILEAFSLGAADYIMKPFEEDVVLARVKAHLMLKKSQDDLRKYERIVSATPDLVSMVDADYIYQIVNHAYLAAHGKPQHEIIGRSVTDLHGEDIFKKVIKEKIDQCLVGETIQYEGWFDYKNIGKKFMSITYSPYIATTGTISGVVITSHDITPRKEMEQRLRYTLDTLEQTRQIAGEADRLKNEFLANMSHEIRTPMNAIIGFTSILLSQTHDPKQKIALDAIQINASNLLSILNDIIDLSKISAGKLYIVKEPVIIESLFSAIQLLFANRFREKELLFTVEIDENVPYQLRLDEVKIRQVLGHLVDNALKFTHKGLVKLRVYPRENWNARNRIHLTFEVEDTGIGISPDQQSYIFENFRQLDGSIKRKYNGTGIGLALTKKLTEMMNGAISLKSQVGLGTTFRVTLSDVEVLEVSKPFNESKESRVKDFEFEPATILMIDPDAFNRDLVKACLQETPLSIIDAESWDQSLQILSIGCEPSCEESFLIPDLILIDSSLFDRNGEHLNQSVQIPDRLKTVPVLAILDFPAKQDHGLGEHLFAGVVRKPVDKKELIAELKNHLPGKEIETIRGKENIDDVIEEGELIRIMEEEFIPKWKTVNNIYFIEKIEEFASEVDRIGKKHNFMPLSIWSQTVNRMAEAFDLNNLQDHFNEFPKIIKKLKKTC